MQVRCRSTRCRRRRSTRASTSLRRLQVRARGVPGLVRLLVRGKTQSGEGLLYAHDLDRLLVRCDRPLPLQVDGEDLGDVTEAVFEAERDAVTVLV